ncbi:MAG TPA: hypothetical protein DD670_14300 [Planctomycetaceae bacterium]|nr:hypothetical protein [Planctomycetaceae bacterium]
MFDERLLDTLVCPENRMRLATADTDLLERVNRAIARGVVVNRGGHVVTEPLAAALLRQDGRLLYPVVDDIPVMLLDEAVALDSLP